MSLWDYQVIELRRAVDGDTYDLTLHKRMDFGFNIHDDKTYSARFRLWGIDVVEHNQAGGAAATAFASDWIKDAIYHDVLRGETFKSEGILPDGQFGRWLIDLYRTDNQAHLADALRAAGYEKVKAV